MSRKEFMEELENMLGNIQDSEREEALQYYNDYFDEAGPENEEQVIRELGTPAKVAAIIKTSLQESENESGEFTERGYSDPRFTINYEVIDSHKSNDKQESNNNETNNNETNNKYRRTGRERTYAKETSGGKIALIIILCIIAIPVALPILGSIIGLLFAILGTIVASLAAIFLAAIGLSVGGAVLFITGIVMLFSTPAVGVFSCGVGLLMLGIGVLFLLLSGIICNKFIPWFVRGTVNLIRVPLRRRGTI